MIYDYLIVGAGLFGSVCARELTDAGKRVLVIERRGHVGGNCADEVRDGIRISLYGGHIFHTNSRRIWNYVNRFSEWQQYEHRVKAVYQGVVYSFPPNLMTCQQLGVEPGPEADCIIKERFFRGYTEKQWGRPLEDVPASVIKRIPIRSTWDDRYFDDKYQGLPVDGYSRMIARMLDGVTVVLNADYLSDRAGWDIRARQTIYTGPLDELYGHEYGRLEYRSLHFKHTRYEVDDWQGCAVMNYTEKCVPFTRTTEWRYMWRTPKLGHTWVTHEYPAAYDGINEPYYPVGDERNNALHRQYAERAKREGLIVGGRMGSYRYINMDQAIGAALALVEKLT